MSKKDYMKPAMKVVELQHSAMLLQARQTSTNLAPEDEIEISDTPASTGFWGR